jgi:hypothetical protein
MLLPLEGLFLHLVRNGFPLSLRDYDDALVALRLGHGTLTRARLQWLCENLWAHTDEEKIRLATWFRDFSQPTPEAIRKMTGAGEQASEPATVGEAEKAEAAAKHSREQATTQAPLVEFAAAEEPGGIGLPHAAVPSAMLQPHILTPRPSVGFRQMVVTWRRFRLAHRTGPKVHLDIDATIAEKCRSGTLTDLVLVPARRNEARMLVLFRCESEHGAVAHHWRNGPELALTVPARPRGGLLLRQRSRGRSVRIGPVDATAAPARRGAPASWLRFDRDQRRGRRPWPDQSETRTCDPRIRRHGHGRVVVANRLAESDAAAALARQSCCANRRHT